MVPLWWKAMGEWHISCHKVSVMQKVVSLHDLIMHRDGRCRTKIMISLHQCNNSNDVMSTIASQITNLTIVYSTVYSGADQRKHQSSASLAFVWGIHRGPVNSPAQMASNAENVSIWGCHHVKQYEQNQFYENTPEHNIWILSVILGCSVSFDKKIHSFMKVVLVWYTDINFKRKF